MPIAAAGQLHASPTPPLADFHSHMPGFAAARAYALRPEAGELNPQPTPLNSASDLAADILLDGTPLHHHDDPTLPAGWPICVPAPELLRHLVETFFDYHPHAGRLLSREGFMASLAQPAMSKAFPSGGACRSSTRAQESFDVIRLHL